MTDPTEQIAGKHITNKKWSLRRRLVGRILRALFGRPERTGKLRPAEISRVLLIRHDRLGDYIVSTPVIEQLRASIPGVEIDLLAGPHNAAFIRHDPRISRVITFDGSLLSLRRAIRECRERRYDLVLQLVLSKTTVPAIFAGLFSKEGRVISRANSYNRALVDHPVRWATDLHYSAQTFDVLLDAIDFGPTEPARPPYRIEISDAVRTETIEYLSRSGLTPGSFILVNMSAGSPSRSFDEERGTELLRSLIEEVGESIPVAATGGPEDADRIARSCAASGAIQLRFPSILSVVAAIEAARLLVTPDTGPVHIASAVGTPVVAYYSEHDKPQGWAPRGVPNRIVVAKEHDVVATVSIEEIVEGVRELLASIESNQTRRGHR